MSKGVYLGNNGSVEIARSSLNAPLAAEINAADVNVDRRRFSVTGATGTFISGDRIEIIRTGGGDLQLVANHAFPDWSGFVNIDSAGGMRLYDSFRDAINGRQDEALELIAPTVTNNVTMETTDDGTFRFLSQVQSYDFTTNRNTIDLTGIGDEFQRMYASGLISGQGTIDCFWEYERALCDNHCGDNESYEVPQYIAELVIRLQQGSSFAANLHLLTQAEGSVWWECPICIVTNVAMNFEPTQPIHTRIQFITSGEILMQIGQPEGFIALQQGDLLLQEDDFRIELEDD